jgi:response regulator RpfG family c-di-GMP phosphodiesterase
LTRKLDEKIKRLNAIQEATRLVISTTNLREVLTNVMKLMVKVTGFERAVLMMVDEEEGVLKFGQGVGADEEQIEKFANYKVPLTRMSNLMVQVAHEGMPTYIDDVKSSALNLDNPLIKEFVPSSFLLVPVTVRDKVIGVLAADKGSTRAAITQDDQDYLIAFVNQIAGAIENSRLVEHNRKNYLSGIKSLVTALEARDAYTRGHSERVTYYSVELANLLDLPPPRIDLLADIVPLHDIGKLGLPDSLLLKMTPLEKNEIEAIRNHTVLGEQIVAQLSLDKEGLAVIRGHHEWFNGQGYPDGLAGLEISDMARIVSITDAFDAMTTRRPYRAGMSIRGAISQLEQNANTQFDPIIVKKFAEAIKAGLIKLPGNIPQL